MLRNEARIESRANVTGTTLEPELSLVLLNLDVLLRTNSKNPIVCKCVLLSLLNPDSESKNHSSTYVQSLVSLKLDLAGYGMRHAPFASICRVNDNRYRSVCSFDPRPRLLGLLYLIPRNLVQCIFTLLDLLLLQLWIHVQATTQFMNSSAAVCCSATNSL